MKVQIRVTPLIALDPIDMEFEGDISIGDINELCAAKARAAVQDFRTKNRMYNATSLTVRWHEDNVKIVRTSEDGEQPILHRAFKEPDIT